MCDIKILEQFVMDDSFWRHAEGSWCHCYLDDVSNCYYKQSTHFRVIEDDTGIRVDMIWSNSRDDITFIDVMQHILSCYTLKDVGILYSDGDPLNLLAETRVIIRSHVYYYANVKDSIENLTKRLKTIIKLYNVEKPQELYENKIAVRIILAGLRELYHSIQ